MPSPDPSLPPDDELRAAEAALRREWAEMKEEVWRADREMEEDDGEAKAAAARRMHELLTGLVERHRKALLARGGDPARLDPAVLTQHFQEFINAEREYQKAEDALLIATANKADAEQAQNIQLLQKLEQWEALPDSAWDAMMAEQRAKGYEAWTQLRDNREALCADLPLGLRQEWERRLGI